MNQPLKVVEAAERFGNGHAAFRVVRSSADLMAFELIIRNDVPTDIL
jgi:hypothetical protein